MWRSNFVEILTRKDTHKVGYFYAIKYHHELTARTEILS